MDNPMDHNTLLLAAQASHRAGRLEDAASVYQNLLARDADHADACYGLGTVLLQQGELAQAVTYLERAAELDPTAPEIFFNLGLALEKAQKVERARAACIRAAELADGEAELLARICRKLLHLRMPQEVYSLLHAHGVLDQRLLVLKAKAQAAIGDWGGAVADLRSLKDRNPDDPGVWRRLATAVAQLRDYDTSLEAYERYLSLKAPNKEDLLAHADLLFMARDPRRAGQAVAQVINAGDRQPQALFIAARCARLDGRYDKARDYLREAIEKRPGFGSAWELLFECVDRDELPQFVSECTELISRGAGAPRDRLAVALVAGRALERLGHHEEAFDHFRLGNREHRALLEANHSAYDASQTEAQFKLIRSFFPAAVQRTEPPRTRLQPIFIVGMPRSGTTLLERMLTCLDGVEGGGEIEGMEFVAAQYYWDLRRGRTVTPGMLNDEEWEYLASQYAARVSGTDASVIDKMPHNARHVGLICAMYPSAPVIYMRRDPRDVCLSIYSRLFPDGHRYACDLTWLSHFSAQVAGLMEHWKAIVPGRILEVRYEDLVDRPVPVTREIAEFCGLDWKPDCLRFHENVDHSFTFSEMQVRRPLNRDGIGRWRHYERQLQPLTEALEEHDLL